MEKYEKGVLFESIIERLKDVLDANTITDVYTTLDIPKSTYDTWKNRNKVPDIRLREISKEYGINKKWLETGEGDMLKITGNDNGKFMVTDAGSVYNKSDQVSIPYHAEVYASAGGGSDATSMEDTSPVSFSRHFLNTFLGIYNVRGLSIINAAGNSMDPTIKSGELMFIYPTNGEEFKDGSIYVLMCGDKLLVKRVTFNPLTKEYTLVSDNGSVDPVTLSIDECSDCRFVGRVVGHFDRV